MEPTLTPYGTSTYTTVPGWGIMADEIYIYGEPIYYPAGWCQVGYYTHWFESEQDLLEFMQTRTLLEHIPPYRPDDGQLPWMPGEFVIIGMLRVYNEQRYRCKQAHTTQSDYTPDITPALWETVPMSDEWIAGAWYEAGKIVTYHDVWYNVLQSHTSQSNWQPPNVPALFEPIPDPQITPDLPEWVQPEETPYSLYETVQLDGIAYQSMIVENWWHPLIYGWRVVGTVSDNPCEGVQIWNPSQHWTTYQLGDRRVWQGKLYECINTAWSYLEPGTVNGNLGWLFITDCQ
jgi:hypothetical protein